MEETFPEFCGRIRDGNKVAIVATRSTERDMDIESLSHALFIMDSLSGGKGFGGRRGIFELAHILLILGYNKISLGNPYDQDH